MGGFAWVTLATNDSYALGALVLAHSLRRAGTPHDLVALVTPGVSAAMRNQLSSIFTLIQEVNLLDSRDEAHLALLERPDLGVTFTKLHCWRLTQYEKCVFLDADTLVLKNSDELFEREELSAAPDPGWPDCFNSGVFVFRPSIDTFNALIKFALSTGSFDGGDQGLLNLFFSDWATKDISRHLPFIYNMVSTATYSYLPAYKQFGDSVKIVHFIGANKPWLQYFDSETRLVRPPPGVEHTQPLLQLWWDIFCSTVHPSLSPEMLGLAGALAQLKLGSPRSAEQAAFEEHMRKQSWEQGTMDYMGRDSFDNIWRKISETLAQAPQLQEVQKSETQPETQKPETQPETQKPEVPPTKSTSEPKIPESNVPEPKSRKSPPVGTKEEPGLTSPTAEPTQTQQSTKGIETPGDTKPSAPTPITESISEEGKSVPVVPHTPLVIEATPPTSPPIVVPTAPLANIQALKVDAPPPETPPVESVVSKLVTTTKPTDIQTTVDVKSQSSPITESSELEQPIIIEQKQSAETIEAPCKDIPISKETTSTVDQAPKEIPITPEVEKPVSSTPPSQVTVPKESLTPSGDKKVLGSAVPEVPTPVQVPAPKEAPESTADEKVVDSTVSQVQSPQDSKLKECPVSSGDEKVVSSTVPELSSSPSVLPPDQIPTAKGDEKVISSTFPEALPSSQVSAPKITSESLTGENVVGSIMPEVPVPSQVSVNKETPTSVASEKVVSPTEIKLSTPKETVTSVTKETVLDSTVSEVPPLPMSSPKETPTTVDAKVVTPAAPEIPPSPQVSDPKETPKSGAAVPQVQPLQSSVPTDISVPEANKQPSAPIVADVTQPLHAAAPKEIPPSEQTATPLAEVPSSPQVSAPKEEEKIVTPVAKAAAPVIPQAPVTPQVSAPTKTEVKPEITPQVPALPAETKVKPEITPQVPSSPAESQTKPVITPKVPTPPKTEISPKVPSPPVEIEVKSELPVSTTPPKDQKQAAPIPAEAVKPQSGEKQVPEGQKSVPTPTSPTKTKSVSKPTVKKSTEQKETTQSGSVSPPQTPDAPPSEQAPVPPKRRGHKSASATPGAEQGASSKPAQPQPQQTKGSKPGQKGKK